MFRCGVRNKALPMLVGAVGVFGLHACSTTNSSGGGPAGIPGSGSTTSPSAPKAAEPTVRVVFRGGKVFAREGDREWPIAEVGRDEMLWAPDGLRFAYVKLKPKTPPASQPADGAGDDTTATTNKKQKSTPKKKKRRRRRKPEPELFVIVVRNIRGDSINEFSIYRPGHPSELDWIDNDRIGYLAPPDKSGEVYVLHAVESGDILKVFRGDRFIWSPGRKRLAYVMGKRKQTVRVNDETVWPRDPAQPPPKRRRRRGKGRKDRRHILGDLVWSPDGGGLAFMEQKGPDGRLVVLLVLDNKDGDLSWPLPAGALAPDNRLFWGEGKVIIGTSVVKPRFAASWKRLH